jgi:stage V sporulation protein D (sporulation-specific penicillin-binding protein)
VYDEYLNGQDGTILTYTDARGREVEDLEETRIEPVSGSTLQVSLDYNIQSYCMQAAQKAYLQKEADSVNIIMMNPKNGEVLAMVDYPEFNPNDPFTLTEQYSMYADTDKENDYLNEMWRNQCVNDTYEPGSTFKIITTSAAFEEKVVTVNDNFYCPGYIEVEDRRIRCHKTSGHGSETFVEGIKNSCNPVFIDIGLRLGTERYYHYFKRFGLLDKTNIDIPGEANTIMHKVENIGPVELATISFGQSFQITPIQLATTVSSLINGGTRVTPHIGMSVTDTDNHTTEFEYEYLDGIVSEETSKTVRDLLRQVVSDGTGSRARVEGYEIGGKTATSQTLPRSENKYISSFIGFAPADDPEVLVLVIINNPTGIYYGGTIAAPIAQEIFANILPYLDK